MEPTSRYQPYEQQGTTPFSAVAGNTVAKYGDRASKESSRMRGKSNKTIKKPPAKQNPEVSRSIYSFINM